MMRATVTLAILVTAFAATVLAAAAPPPARPQPTRAEAAAFLRRAENEIGAVWIARERANWVRATFRTAGDRGPLHRCSIYGSKAAGAKLQAMMEMGQSRPWPEALRAMTGEDQLDATALLEYFKPLQDWLAEQNRGRACGW
jgi:hypothetical protein